MQREIWPGVHAEGDPVLIILHQIQQDWEGKGGKKGGSPNPEDKTKSAGQQRRQIWHKRYKLLQRQGFSSFAAEKESFSLPLF